MKNTNLIALQGETPLFRETETSNLKQINQRTFSEKLRDFNCVQSLRFTWEKASEYLEQIINKKDSKRMKKAVLKVAAQDLDFNLQATNNVPDLTQKIKSAFRSSKPKPKNF